MPSLGQTLVSLGSGEPYASTSVEGYGLTFGGIINTSGVEARPINLGLHPNPDDSGTG